MKLKFDFGVLLDYFITRMDKQYPAPKYYILKKL